MFEPAECGVPVLFGPYMRDQLDLARQVIDAGAGKQVSIEEVGENILSLLTEKKLKETMSTAGLELALEVRGAALRTWEKINPYLNSKIEI